MFKKNKRIDNIKKVVVGKPKENMLLLAIFLLGYCFFKFYCEGGYSGKIHEYNLEIEFCNCSKVGYFLDGETVHTIEINNIIEDVSTEITFSSFGSSYDMDVFYTKNFKSTSYSGDVLSFRGIEYSKDFDVKTLEPLEVHLAINSRIDSVQFLGKYGENHFFSNLDNREFPSSTYNVDALYHQLTSTRDTNKIEEMSLFVVYKMGCVENLGFLLYIDDEPMIASLHENMVRLTPKKEWIKNSSETVRIMNYRGNDPIHSHELKRVKEDVQSMKGHVFKPLRKVGIVSNEELNRAFIVESYAKAGTKFGTLEDWPLNTVISIDRILAKFKKANSKLE